MNKKLYKLMDWAAIEEIIYSECDHPQELLGPHSAGNGTLVQAYFPGASAVSVKWLSADPLKGDQFAQMEVADEDGYFAVILPEKKIFNYTYSVTYETATGKKTIKKNVVECGDPYRHSQILSNEEIESFCSGKMIDAYNKLGAHVMKHAGESGVHFAVWAPNALRVSVIGEFNNWDGRIHQMIRLNNGMFELFIPGVLAGQKFQYEIKLKGDVILKRNDPYSLVVEEGASVITQTSSHKWTDGSYVKGCNNKSSDILIYELSNDVFSGDTKKYKKEADKLIKSVVSQGFTHILMNPVSQDNNVTSYLFANTKSISCENLMSFVESCHKENLGVIFTINLAGFGRTQNSMEYFDGTALFEHQNPLQGESSDGSRKIFQYAKPEVISFLKSNCFYWLKKFHADGLSFADVAQMLYLDYGKTDGAWIANSFGGNENLEAIDFIKSVITDIKNEFKASLIIAEDSSTHNGMTTSISEGGMGFDFKWNEGYSGEFFDYMSNDPINRSSQHNRLVDEFVYAFAEKFILPLSDKIVYNNSNMLDGFPGSDEMKNNALKLSLAFQYMHPGVKLVASSMDMLQSKLCQELNKIYKYENALSAHNDDPESFEWLSNMKADGCYISYVRRTEDPEEMLVTIMNFAGIEQTITSGVPYEGKYVEILNTDDKIFGGTGILNPGENRACATPADGRPQSITINLAPQSMSIMKFVPYTEEELAKVIEERIREFTPVKRKQ